MKLIDLIKGTHRKLLLFLFDVFCVFCINVAYYLIARYSELGLTVFDIKLYFINAFIMLGCIVAVRLFFRVYANVWRYTSTRAYFNLVLSDAVAGLIAMLISKSFGVWYGIWYFVLIAALSALCALMSRFTYRLLYKRRNASNSQIEAQRTKVAIVGAGELGSILVNDLRCNPKSQYIPKFFIDVNLSKAGSIINELHVYGESDAKRYLDKYGVNEVIIAISNIEGEAMTELYNFYKKLGCKVKIYESPFRDGSDTQKVVRDFSIEDLLFRAPLAVNDSKSFSYYAGKTVLVTGGGGSIGSELCRQLAKCKIKKLIILDIYENNAYDIQQELIRKYKGELDLSVEIASVRDVRRLECVFRQYRPDVVFHAAAHKHVPLMETGSAEALKNNVFGTYNTANMAEKYGVEKFVLVSTDKAVNPTNIMGASKRLCEMVIQCRTDSKTSFTAVRFGNVLGSNGSVVPLFKRQIAQGGPITITDKRIIRYFMTIPEASQLLVQAGAMAKKGELFVLDMGKPVRIYDLAVNMIRLSGLEPEKDIKIKEIGLRSGEKLYEELLMKTEKLDKTENDMIFIERDMPLTREQVEDKLDILQRAIIAADDGDNGATKAAIIATVPTFKEPSAVNAVSSDAEEMKHTVKV